MKGGYKDGVRDDFYGVYDSDLIATDVLEVRMETIPINFGPVEGTAKIYHFEGGAIFHNAMFAREDYRLYSQSGPLIKIHFCLKGEKLTGIARDGRAFFVRQNENNLYHFVDCEGYFDFKAGQKVEYVDICLDESFFVKITENYAPVFLKMLESIREGRFAQIQHTPVKSSLRMKSVLAEILNSSVNTSLRKAYFINKLIELMLLQLDAVSETAFATKCVCKTPEDRKKIELARCILLSRYANPPTLLELSRAIGINDNKLKRGFKELYNNTVMGYVNDYKLSLANDLIQTKNYTLTEICDQLGYSSLAYFSRAYKKKFNINPSSAK